LRDACPDPLIYYLHAAALAHHQAVFGAGFGEDPPYPGPPEAAIAANAADLSVWDLAEASSARLTAMTSGIDKWRAHPFRRHMPEPPVIWAEGSARLLDYGRSEMGQPVLVVPSLINKPYILDLMEDASFLRYLAQTGLRPVLLDWGSGRYGLGGPQTIDAYMSDILHPAFSHLADATGTTPGVLGYCMGGTLAVGLSARLGTKIDRLALIGAPWDFSQLAGVSQALKSHSQQVGVEKLRAGLQAMGQHFGAVPAQVFQQLFAFLSPMQVVQKFSAFDKTPLKSAAAHKFVAVEDWLADGVCVKAPTAETILVDWYLENRTGRGQWHLGGAPVDPGQIACPTLVITGQKDHIVPPALAAPLADAVPNAQHVSVDMGHVGMIVGSRAHALVADRISDFFDVK